jgi:hypothetical protein
MRALSAAELLSVWERGLSLSPPQRALDLLATACPESSLDELSVLSVGQRDARLLSLRELTFGSEVAVLMNCPACGTQLQLALNLADIRMTGEDNTADTRTLSLHNYDIRFRLPNSLDLSALTAGESAASGAKLLLKRCVLSARYQHTEVDVEELPDEILDAIDLEMDHSDPQADVQLSPECLQCKHRWQAPFDIESFFWSEIQAWAERTLREVHLLARAYGWREADILNMSPRRRWSYLEMLGT